MRPRVYVLLLLAGALALAGCAVPVQTIDSSGKNEPLSVHLEQDYMDPDLASKTVAEAFDVPPGNITYDVLAIIGGKSVSVCGTTNDARLVVYMPSGAKYADLSPTSPSVDDGLDKGGCAKKEDHGIVLEPGQWRVEFSGYGTFKGLFDVKPSV